MNIIHDWFWRRFRHRGREHSFSEFEIDGRIVDEVMRRMYERYPNASWVMIQRLYPNEVARERNRVRIEFRRYIFPIRKLLGVWYRILSSFQS